MVSKSQDRERPENASGGTAGMHAVGKSDGSVVPAKPANKGAAEAPAESAEERDPAKRNADQDNLYRTPGRNEYRLSGLERVRERFRARLEARAV